MNNQSCMKRPMLIDLHPDELHYYPFHSLDNCDGSCHTVEDQFGRTCVPNKKEHENLKGSNMIKRINKKSLKFICECRCEFDGRKCNSKQNLK